MLPGDCYLVFLYINSGLQVLFKVFYYDAKTKSDMESSIQNAFEASEAKFADEIQGLRALVEAMAEKPAAKK